MVAISNSIAAHCFARRRHEKVKEYVLTDGGAFHSQKAIVRSRRTSAVSTVFPRHSAARGLNRTVAQIKAGLIHL